MKNTMFMESVIDNFLEIHIEIYELKVYNNNWSDKLQLFFKYICYNINNDLLNLY